MKVDISTAQKGFKGRREKFRVAWSLSPNEWSPECSAVSKSYRILKMLNMAGVEYVRGRDEAEFCVRQKRREYKRIS